MCSRRTSVLLGQLRQDGELPGWSAVMDGHQLFRRGRQRRPDQRYLSVKQCARRMDILCGYPQRLGESSRVRMRREVSEGVLVAVVHCGPTGHGVCVDGASFKQLREVSVSQTLVLRGDFKLDDICQKAKQISGGCQG